MLTFFALISALAASTVQAGDIPTILGCDAVKAEGVKGATVSCTNEYNIGSRCVLSCAEYYDLAGTTDRMIEATCQSNGTWSGSTEIECIPIRCLPAQQSPENGNVVCSASNLAQSVCVFFCDDHFDMVGLETHRNAYSTCKDDGDGDEFGNWMPLNEVTQFPPSFPPKCDPIQCQNSLRTQVNGKVFCSNRNYSGSHCVVLCNDGYKLKGTREKIIFSTCKMDDDYDGLGEWTIKVPPPCIKCKNTRKVQLVALIHESENDTDQFNIASSMISRVVTIMRRRYRLRTTVTVNRYSSSVDATNEVFTTAFVAATSKAKIDAIPFDGGRANTTAALLHINDKLNQDDSALIAFIFTNELRDFDRSLESLAENLKEKGVGVFIFTIRQKNRALTWFKDQLVRLAGDEDMVYSLPKIRFTHKYKFDIAAKINTIASRKGCDMTN